MANKLFNILKYLLFVGLGIYLVIWSLKDINLQDVWLTIKTANLKILAIVAPAIFLSHWTRAMRWKLMIQSFDKAPKRFNVYSAVIIGYLLNLVFPRLGEVGKCTIIAKYEKISPPKLIGTMVVERAIDLISLVIIIFMAIGLEYDNFYAYFYNTILKKIDFPTLKYKLILTGAVCIAILITLIYIVRKYPDTKFSIFVETMWQGFLAGLLSVKRMKNKWYFIFLSLSIWACYILGTWLSFYALEATSHLSISVAFPILVMGSIAMVITQGGVGAYWGFLQQALLIYYIDKNAGFAYGCLNWSSQYAFFILSGIVCWVLLPIINKKKVAHE